MAVQRLVGLLCVGTVMCAAGCGLISDPASPSTTTPPTETFTGTLAPQGTRIFSFTVTHAGTLSVTLTALTPSGISVGLGVGTSSGTNANACTATTSTPDATAGSTAQLTVTAAAGSYCVKVYDSGNVSTTTTFTIEIVHS